MIGENLRLGFIPLADCAPLAVADAFGLFAEEGLSVTLSREASWATIRDKVQARLLDGAHMLGPIPLACSLGVGGPRSAMIAPMALNLNGSAITVSRRLADRMRTLDGQSMSSRPRSARALKRVVEERRAAGAAPLTFAAVFQFSLHAYLLRYWLADSGVDPDHDVRLVITPPPRMASQLRSGEIDGFCVGAPWNAVVEADRSGEVLARARELWPAAPDKVLGVSAAFAQRDPEALQALLRSLIRAADWADAPENRPVLAQLLARPEYVGEAANILRRSLVESPDGIVFRAAAANFPWRSHAAWLLAQMRRWGQSPADADLVAAATAVYRPDLYRLAAREAGAAAPLDDWKVEGGHAGPFSLPAEAGEIPMPADRIFDGRAFDPGAVERYLAGFGIRREAAPAAP